MRGGYKMFSLKVKNNRNEEMFITGNSNYTLFKIEGLNPPQATINSSVNATTDGSIINSVRTENRNIVLYLAIEGDVETNRLNVYKYFPIKQTVTLYFSNGSRDVYIKGIVEVIECDLFSNKQIAQVSIVCPQPYFKTIEELSISFGDVLKKFQFPFSIPAEGIEFSPVVSNQRKTIVNTGDAEAGIIIELFAVGTVENPVIYNVLTGGKMQFNATMLPSDKIIVNTNVGEKSITLIREGVSYNAMGLMTAGSEWFKLINGDNVFTYDADSGTSSLQLNFTAALLYSGV